MVRRFSLSAITLLSMACLSSAASAASLAPPGVYYGTGNTNTNWTIATSGNVEVGLRAKPRGSASDLLSVGNMYFAPLGADPADATKAFWNWDFSVNSGPKALSNYTATITISDNLGGTPVSFNPLAFGDNATYIAPPNSWVTGMQNSENPVFASIFSSPYNMNTPAIYTIKLDVTGFNVSASDTIYVNVSGDLVGAAAAVPVPAAASAGLSMLAALGIFSWVKRKLSSY